MSNQIDDHLTEFENLMLNKMAKIEEDIQLLKSGTGDIDWDDAQSFTLELDTGSNAITNTQEEFARAGVCTVSFSEGKRGDHSKVLLECRALIVTFFEFKLWEDGQFHASAYGRNRSGHARWIYKLRMRFRERFGPSPAIPGSGLELFWLGGKKNSDHTEFESGRYEFGKSNFERMRRGELTLELYGKCKRTR